MHNFVNFLFILTFLCFYGTVNVCYADEESEVEEEDDSPDPDAEIVITGTKTSILMEDSTVSVDIISAEEIANLDQATSQIFCNSWLV